MRIKTINLISQGAASNTAFSAATALTAGVSQPLTTAAASISPAREVTLTSASDLSSVTFTIRGTDRHGNPITELIRGPNAATVRTRKVYSSVTAIIPNTSSANTVSAGYPARVCSNWLHNETILSNGDVPTARLAVLSPDSGETFGDGLVEVTYENVMQITGEGAETITTTISLPSVGTAVSVTAPYFRIVNVNTTSGARLRCSVARPSF